MKLLFISVFVLLSTGTTAQHKLIFSSQNYAGILEGEHRSKFQLQTINGIKFNTWFMGLGTGIDWYYLRSIPAFFSLNKDFWKRENRNFFIVMNGGINFPWKRDNYYNEWGYRVDKLVNGVYWEGGLGYKIGIGKGNDALLIQLGYSYKQVGEKAIVIYTDTPELNPMERFDYRLRRLSLKIGWNF